MSELIERKLAWLHYNRELEVDSTADLLKQAPGKKLLEIGGGDGFVAKRLADLGYNVTSIDLAPRYPHLYPVQKGDATKLDFPNASFDIVYTCHVLEEIHNIPETFSEMRRVLKPNGIAVHVVASSSWAVLTNFWHFAMLPGAVFNAATGRKKETFSQTSLVIPDAAPANGSQAKNEPPETSSQRMRRRLRWMFLHPVGAHPSFVHEIMFFSKSSWRRVMRKNGFVVASMKRGPVVQSGYRVMPFKAMGLRKGLAPVFSGSITLLAKPLSQG